MKSCQVLFLCLLSACWSPSAQDSRSYLVSAPKSLRLDARERVVVQLFGYSEESLVQVLLKSSMASDHVLYDQTQLRLNAQNQYQDAASLRISEGALAKEATQVVLHVLSMDINQHKSIPVSRRNGFLFLQTDKPLYTPGQAVKVRAFSLNEELSPALRPVFLTFSDPDREKVDIVEMTDLNGVPSLQNPFKIPLKPKQGIWSIEGSYSKTFTTTARVEFEVKEYVLPSIVIKMDPQSNYISYQNFHAFNIKISARYLHGAPVTDGEAFVRYGYVSGKTPPVIIPSSLKRHDMTEEGECEVLIEMKAALSSLDGPRDLEGLAGRFLYVAVLVQEATGGIIQEAELATVKFLKSPYNLDLVATPLFIKPSLPYTIRVSVKDHLGKPVSGVPVSLVEPQSLGEDRLSTRLGCSGPTLSQATGLALFICNPPADSVKVTMTVVTAVKSFPEASQTELPLVAVAYHSPNQRYLYIDLPEYSSGLQVGRYLTVNVYVTKPPNLSLASLSYLIISKGKTVGFGSEALMRGGYQVLRVMVTPAMVPSVRLLVYYVLYGEHTSELVADSIWVDIKDACVNGLKTEISARGRSYKPKEMLLLDVKSTQEGLVALSAVDTAIYSLRVPHMDPVNRVLRLIEQSDQGCGGGGGKDNADVFRLAGLTFMTNANAADSDSTESCTAAVRAKRQLKSQKFKEKAEGYGPLSKCCLVGMQYPPSFQTCRETAAQFRRMSRRCQNVFEECCLFALNQNDDLIHARGDMGPEFDQTPSQVRSYFPESWLWEVQLLRSGVTSSQRILPDSLTTWEIRAVGVYNNGVCVAEPLSVAVSQRVSVNVPLPYSMVRGQQIQLKGSVYNMEEEDMEYCVTVTVGPAMCLFQGSPSKDVPEHQTSPCQMSSLKGGTVGRVTFILLPLEAGSHPLTFTLKTTHGVKDVLVKQLKVVPEGVRKEVSDGGRLDPQAIYGSTELIVSMKNRLPPNLVPKSSVERVLTINGDILGEVVSVVEDPEGIKRLASLPPGSAEAELVRVLPLYHLYNYLDVKQCWEVMGLVVQDSKDKLQQKIKEGLNSISTFKSATDYSYKMWLKRESSTWLTATVLKALAQIDKYVPVNHQSLSNTISWLISQTQSSNGAFRELSPYIKPVRVMGAGADELQQSVYVTSHVLIGLLTALQIRDPVVQLRKYDDSVKKAANYVSQHAAGVKSVYVRAVATYALTLHDRNHMAAVDLFESLERKAQEKGNPVVSRFWREEGEGGWVGDRPTGRSVETTALVLLTSLLLGRLDYTKPILNWISQDQHYGGGLGSTQDTVLVLEALTEYSRVVRLSSLNLEVSARYTRKGELGRQLLTQNKPIASPIQVTEEDEIKVSTGFGTGVSNVKLKTVYYELLTSSQNCNFEFNIEVLAPISQSTNYLWRSNRIQACARFIRPVGGEVTESSLTVMEIQLPTGVDIFTDDLKKFRDGLEPIISHYEVKGDTVIIQMDSVPSENFLCLVFRIQENFQVDATSNSMFRVYEPQDHGSMCSKVYSDRVIKLLPVCEGEQCVCVTAECASYREEITADRLKEDTCQQRIKYAFKVKVKSTVSQGDFLLYTAVLENIFKKGALESIVLNLEVELIKKASCSSVALLTGSSYLIAGSESITITLDRSFKYRYVLDSGATVDSWPTDCRDPACSQRLDQLLDYEEQFLFHGC